MKFKLNFIGILVTLNLLLVSALEAGERRSVEITDNAGRRVEISVPVERAVASIPAAARTRASSTTATGR